MSIDWIWNKQRRYHYRSLSKVQSESRPLTLKASSLHDSRLQCILAHVSHDWMREHEYETISYCWGDRIRTSIIEVDGRTLRIPPSAEQALRRLRNPSSDRVVWIASVCIDQADVHERSQQVSYMHFIYRHGRSNLIWLGEDDGTISEAAHALKMLVEELESDVIDLQSLCDTLYGSAGFIMFSGTGFGTTFSHDAVLGLYCRPWFSRLWIVQEITLARCNVCFCGEYEFDLLYILRAAQWLYLKQRFLSPGHQNPAQLSAVRTAVVLAGYVDPLTGWFAYNESCHFADLLTSLDSFNTREPQDQVFACLGI
ncbi:hypothetical protein CLAFUW4_08427 [Fulvia fulva]|uniref:Heterokaryon incompatibility domain-containing protein n=1 Tax=Passalora fulva TaxID=5499 RepID=A0A9Q8P6V9_PASFU|nr:uncharacterized protein CLAFUR5_08531 [Fulvia fulva]UJO15419.1 hypothetical protein CLAFUR5_08531 [Fulvia fulva]WPV12503.1 hypothetical protein CLAFUW4_08427 [Fulvia fulva]